MARPRTAGTDRRYSARRFLAATSQHFGAAPLAKEALLHYAPDLRERQCRRPATRRQPFDYAKTWFVATQHLLVYAAFSPAPGEVI